MPEMSWEEFRKVSSNLHIVFTFIFELSNLKTTATATPAAHDLWFEMQSLFHTRFIRRCVQYDKLLCSTGKCFSTSEAITKPNPPTGDQLRIVALRAAIPVSGASLLL